MNIESASLAAPVVGSGMVTNPVPSGDGLEGFAAALVTQAGLISAVKTGEVLSLSALVQATPVLPVSDGVLGATDDAKNRVALLDNNLPSKNDAEHQAVLGAVTDALKYIATGAVTGEQVMKAVENIKDVAAMTDTISQSTTKVIAMAGPASKSLKEVVGPTDLVELSGGGQSIRDTVPTQINSQQSSKISGKKLDQPAGTEECVGVNGLVVAIINPVVTPVENGAIVADLRSADVIKQERLLSFINPFAGNEKKDRLPGTSENVQQSAVLFSSPVQAKQGFKLSYFEGAGQIGITGSVDRPVTNLECVKTLSSVVGDIIPESKLAVSVITKPLAHPEWNKDQILSSAGGDVIPMSKLAVEIKVDVPAIAKPLAHPEWNKDLGERIVWMASRAIPAAEIRLNPPQLGPISVRVDIADDKAIIVFTAQHAVTRDAIEASMPKLREMMSAQQLNLVEVSVSQGSFSDQGRSQPQNFAQTAQGRGQGVATVDRIDEVEQEIESGRAIVSKGLLSIYA